MSLIYVKSKTAEALSNIFAPLEDPLLIHAVLHHASSTLEIELPRLQLAFHVKSGGTSIESRQFRGMFVDEEQSLGTIIGLRNKPLLKQPYSCDRAVVLPAGQVSHEKSDDHVRVTIHKVSAASARAYRVDEQLGRLVDNGSLQSKLFICYLHAVTSFCQPDPLTQRTGTEQALSILDSAAVRSFDQLSSEDVDFLIRIANLTPGRTFYPAKLRVMQTVKWSSQLGFLAQHGGFYKTVKSVFNHIDRMKIFRQETYFPLADQKHINPDLLERDCIRSSTFRISGFGAEDHTSEHDTTYSARDRDQNPEGERRAFVMSSIIYQGRKILHYSVQSDLRTSIWNLLSPMPKILGPNAQLPLYKLEYDASWLEDSSNFLPTYWNALLQVFSRGESIVDKYRVMIWLSTLAFGRLADMQILQTLASFFTAPDMAYVKIPAIDSFYPSRGATVADVKLRDHVVPTKLPYSQCPEAKVSKPPQDSETAFRKRQRSRFQSNQNLAVNKVIEDLEAQWPRAIPNKPTDASLNRYVNLDKVMQTVKPAFGHCFDNHRLCQCLGQIEDTLRRQMIEPLEMSTFAIEPPMWNLQRKHAFISADDMLARSAPSVSPCNKGKIDNLLASSTTAGKPAYRLTALIDRLKSQASSKYEKSYVRDLQSSLISLQNSEKKHCQLTGKSNIKGVLLKHFHACREHTRLTRATLESSLSPVTKGGDSSSPQHPDLWVAAASANQWPRLSPVFLLQQLAQGRWHKITHKWKQCIVDYAVSLTELQRAHRLIRFSGNDADLIKELENPGHKNWSPLDYPESLLLEVESGIMIREEQERIAEQMRKPQSGENAVMQLNMGEGKSSVIVPIVAAALADGSRLVRVIVAKPQSRQMFQMLVSTLGGLLHRRIYHIPVSRALKLGHREACVIHNVCRECMTNGGVLLVQPEHILSMKLMGLECLISGKERIGHSLLSTQRFFDKSSRDIVDESDENFSVKFELIYTMGMQRQIDFSPHRWICIQQVLALFKKFAPKVRDEFPLSIEVDGNCSRSFPRTRILRPDAQQQILSLITRHICETGLVGFPIARQRETVRQAVLRYISAPHLTASEIAAVEGQGVAGFWGDTTRSTLLLLRGLIAGGVLAFTLRQKRWRVNYGLDTGVPPRTRLAVPYRAKDSPSLRSEFSHPDVVIVLTSISHYYGGLGNDDMFLALDHLLESDQADIEYQEWVKDAPELGATFHQLSGINLKDRLQCIEQVFPPLRFAKSTIDYFLTHIIFPKEIKEFPQKLSASGWDIGHVKAHPTTGFSGTNDSRKVLPLGVEHLDLPAQRHTNALVLEYLLQAENSIALIPPKLDTSGSDAKMFLRMVTEMKPQAQVILDVGAQILELDNLGVAKAWLKMISDHSPIRAVVFFDTNDELSVLDRGGHVEPLQTSPFAAQLDVCLVFLDEAHTRGTDLRLPQHYRAAVSLGADLTKDRLVQGEFTPPSVKLAADIYVACMRMRRLGKGQSVVFCIPPEIEAKIRRHTSKPDATNIGVVDVLDWSISQTCIDIRRNMPLWAAQGQRFEHQRKLWSEACTTSETLMSTGQAEKFLEDDCQTLEDRYRPHSNAHKRASSVGHSDGNKDLDLIKQRCREFDDLGFDSAKLQEEQERELCPETEEERQMERPEQAEAAEHLIHPDVVNFISSGEVIRGSKAYKPAFEALRKTSAAAYLDVSDFPQSLLVTKDFARTVRVSGAFDSYNSDFYQRRVQWVLTSIGDSGRGHSSIQQIMIISPYEAQELLPKIEKSRTVTLHLYAPRPNLGFRALDELDLYIVPARPRALTVPRSLVVQLNLFSGQLYLGSFKEYVEVCEFLGLAWDTVEDDSGIAVATDGFILRNDSDHSHDSQTARSGPSTFTKSPVKFLEVLMTKIRRNGKAIDKTHMGAILDGRLLRPSDFAGAENSEIDEESRPGS